MNHGSTWSRRSFLGTLAAVPAFAAHAQTNYPSKPIRMIIPFAAGGATDVLGRYLGQAMSLSLGQAFVVENMGGAAGVPALNTITRAPADGYNVFFCASGNITAQPLMSKNRVDILSQLEPVGMIASAPHVLVVNSQLPIKTVADLIAYGKANPGKLNFATAGIGGLAHLGTELFAHTAGIKITHVPYKGAAQAMNDLVAGNVQAIFGTMPSFTAMLERGTIRAIGMTAPSNSTPLKNVPLISKTLPGFTYNSWNGMFVPVRTPAIAAQKLFAAMKQASTDTSLQKRFDDQGVDLALAGPDALRTTVKREVELWDRVIRDAKIERN